jgi:hypothetical protein
MLVLTPLTPIKMMPWQELAGAIRALSLTGKHVSCQKFTPGFYRIYAMPEESKAVLIRRHP